MPSSSVRSFTNPDDYATALRQGTIGLTVTERGRFRAKLCQINFHHLWMQRLSEELARTSHVDGTGGRTIIVFRTQPGPAMIRNGTEVTPDAIARLSGGKSYYHHTTGPFAYGGMSLPLEKMVSIGESMAGRDLTPPKDDLTVIPSAEAMERLQRVHATAGALAEDAPSVLAHPEAARGIEQALIQATVECMQGEPPQTDRSAARHHAAIMRRFHSVIEEHIDRPLYIPELCTAVGATASRLLRGASRDGTEAVSPTPSYEHGSAGTAP